MFSKKQIPTIELSVTEFLELDDRLNSVITTWAKREAGTGVAANTKLAEILIFNLKLIYSSDDHGVELRSFLQRTTDVGGDTDYIFSRVQDLYIFITMSFPVAFIEAIRNRHITSIKNLGYDVDDNVVESFPFGWLFVMIQYSIRYNLQLDVAVLKKK